MNKPCPVCCPVLTWEVSKGVKMELDITTTFKNNIIHLEYATQHELCLSMVRIQEYYESPHSNIYKSIFTLEEFMDIYAKEKGSFSYLTDWSGFNVSGNIVEEFFRVYKDSSLDGLRLKEIVIEKLINICRYDNNQDFYLIATCKEAPQAIEHELAHAKYYLNNDYRYESMDLIETFPNKYITRLKKTLTKHGYRDDVIIDEIQAYLSTSTVEDLMGFFGGTKSEHTKYSKECRDLLEGYN